MMAFCKGVFCYIGLVLAIVADSFAGDVTNGTLDINADFVVYENMAFNPDVVYVGRPIDFTNYGDVDTKFVVCDRCDLYIKNHGNFKAEFVVGTAANVYQVVSDADDVNPIVSNVEYAMLVDGANGVNLGRALDGTMVGTLVLKDSVIDINNTSFDGVGSVILRGDVVLMLDNLAQVYNIPIFDNVSGDGRVYFKNGKADSLFSDVAYIDDEKLFVRRVRETDYAKIFGNNTGKLLNDLRNKNLNDNLLGALDSAGDMNSVRDIMARTARFNPSVLMKTVRVINAFDSLGVLNNADGWVKTDFVFSDDFNSGDINAGVNFGMGPIKAGLGMCIGGVEYMSGLDAFDGLYYGINLSAQYFMQDNLFIRGIVGADRFDFKIGDVVYNDEFINNPSVLAIGGVVDFGYKYRLGDSFYVVPFVGIDGYKYVMENVSDVFVRGRAGLDVEYTYQMLGIKYEYGFGLGINSDVAIMATGRMGFWSNYDGAGADIKLSVLRMFDMYSYQVSIGGKVCF